MESFRGTKELLPRDELAEPVGSRAFGDSPLEEVAPRGAEEAMGVDVDDELTSSKQPDGLEEAEAENASETAFVGLEERIRAGFDELRKTFGEKLAHDRFKEEQVNRLHDELQEYKRDLLARTQLPLLQGVMRLHDDLGRLVDSLVEDKELTAARCLEILHEFRDDIEILLDGHGVLPFEVVDETFDPDRQTALLRIPTSDRERVGTVAERLRPGFQQASSVLRKERVGVYVAAAIEASEEAAGADQNEPTAPTREDPPKPSSRKDDLS